MFKWNGSNVTYIINDENVTIEESIFAGLVYWRITENSLTEHCLVRGITTTIPCLIDELKPIFGLQKIGTHWLKYHNKLLLLQKVCVKNGIVIKEVYLDETEYHKIIEHEVRKIFTFRELLGIAKNTEKTILL